MSVEQRLAKAQNRKAQQSGLQKIRYVTQAGDSFWEIARKYKVGVRELAKWNGLAPTDPLSINKELVIWLKPEQAKTTTLASANDNAVVRKVYYRVRNGDSLARIAQKFNLSVEEIRSWNSVARKKYLHPGDSLTLFVDVKNIN